MVDRDTEEQLELDDIQGDILVGLQKEAEAFVGFAIDDPVRFKRFLSGLHLTTARDALVAQDRIDAFRANGGTGLLDIRGVNIAFTADGLRKLGAPGVDGVADPAFKAGLASRSADLGDPPAGDGAAANWKVGNGAGPLDGMLLITGRGKAEVMAVLEDVDKAAGSQTWIPFFVEVGTTRPAPFHGHEHFGYLDGVSQPALRGRIDAAMPAKRFLDASRSHDPNQGLPGADLHWPGEFVFGCQAQDPKDVEAATGPEDGGPAWMRNGSFMVFRRLEQLVPEFHGAARRIATSLSDTPDQVEARMVGRFRSGCPISLRPNQDDPALGADPMRNNDFDFGTGDIKGRACPYASHIRKSYPRNDLTPAAGGRTGDAAHTASEANTQTHRVMRRGIPFGPEVAAEETASGATAHSRGLMFVCYQTSIQDQFEFIIRNWVNNPGFAVPEAGHDPILGQAEGAARERFYTGAKSGVPSGDGPAVKLETDFIRPTGGGYFFMPSIRTVRTVLAA